MKADLCGGGGNEGSELGGDLPEGVGYTGCWSSLVRLTALRKTGIQSRRKLSKIDGKIKEQRLFGGPWNCDGLILISTLADEFANLKSGFYWVLYVF
jgi:hypothetical protein